MSQPRSSLAIALQDYKGIRPGVALTIAAVALIAAVVVGVFHIVMLGREARAVAEGSRAVRTLHRYNAALEVWRQMAAVPDSELQYASERQLRDSLGRALRGDFMTLRNAMTDSTDKALVGRIVEDLTKAQTGAVNRNNFDLGTEGREAIILLTGRQDSTLFEAAVRNQRSQIVAAILIGLTVLAAGVLIIPISWVYVRYKQGIPAGM